MKWLRTLVLFNKGDVLSSEDWGDVHASIVRSIASVDHPRGSGLLTIRQKNRKVGSQWDRNGVKYLKSRFLEHMRDSEKWRTEGKVELARNRDQPSILLYPSLEEYREPVTSSFGKFDFMTTAKKGSRIAIEWETGNISSSHRSINKLAIALTNDVIQAGVVIVPSRKFYEHLTDRIGNIGELSGYLSMWEGIKSVVARGVLAIVVVEHDALSADPALPYLDVGNDGNAKKARAKSKKSSSKSKKPPKSKKR